MGQQGELDRFEGELGVTVTCGDLQAIKGAIASRLKQPTQGFQAVGWLRDDRAKSISLSTLRSEP